MRILLILFQLFVIHLTYGQTKYAAGIVVDSLTNEPLIFANIYNPQTKILYRTDINGKFKLELNQYGRTSIYINYPGYVPKLQEVKVNEQYLEVKLLTGMMGDIQEVTKYKKYYEENKTSIDSITMLCNRYTHEIDSLLSIKE